MINITKIYIIFIFSYMSDFKQIFTLFFLFLVLPMVYAAGNTTHAVAPKTSGYDISFNNDPISEKWGNYLYTHLSRRAKQKGIVTLNNKVESVKKIRVEVSEAFADDYYLEDKNNQLILKAKNEKAALWLIYQVIKQLSDKDERLIGNDLPPAILHGETCSGSFDFAYREPYFSPNLENEYAPIIGANMVENDWGIWGHNLSKILQNGSKNSIYATRSGSITKEQYCFSSEEVFKQLKEYIIDNFGNDKKYTQHLMIMPNDNTIVCDCNRCKTNGNTSDSATPALSVLIKRLALEFPYHTFFTTAYLTTKSPPKDKWPRNSGVMISTIDLPKGIALKEQDEEVKHFLNLVTQWKNCTPTVYIWDYASNFDDYLSPLPILYGLKKQLKFFKSKGVEGVFLNASGYDYSSFDDVKTFVAAALMIDGDVSVDDLCKEYFTQFYPKSGLFLSNYYLSLEKRMEKNNAPYNLYGGFQEALNTYLDKEEFVTFYESLDSLISIAEGEERHKLEKLRTALSFARLQLAYHQKNDLYGFATLKNKSMTIKPEITVLSDRLSGYGRFKNLANYKEVGGDLKLYLSNWENIYKKSPFENQLIGEPIKALSKLDEDYKKIDVLNDGVLGFEGDYHQGWLLSSVDDLHVQLDSPDLKSVKRISLRFLVDKKHRINPPSKVVVYKNGAIYKEFKSFKDLNRADSQIIEANIDVDFSDAGLISLKIYRNQSPRSIIACDEIQLN